MATQNDMKPHETTYGGFIGWLKWGTVITVIITAATVYIISN